MNRLGWLWRWAPTSVVARPLSFMAVVLLFLSGSASCVGLSDPTRVTELLHPQWILQMWGAALSVGSVLLFWGMLRESLAIEKLGLRLLSVLILAYTGWVAIALGIHGALQISMALFLLVFFEIRITVLKGAIRPKPSPPSNRIEP